MSWWDDVLNLLRDEFASPDAEIPAEPATARQTEVLLKRTTRELMAAKARAEAARRRMLRAQDELLALTRNEKQHASYRERLTIFAKTIAHESELVEAFDAHILRLGAVHNRIEHEYAKLERDLQMARTAHAAASATQRVKPNTAAKTPPKTPAAKTMPGDTPSGFRRTRDASVMDALKKASKQ